MRPFDLLPVSWIPNEHGFRFVGVTKTGESVDCEVEKGEDGLHRIKGRSVTELRGWRRKILKESA